MNLGFSLEAIRQPNLQSGASKERGRGMFSRRKTVLIELSLFILCAICLAALIVFFLVHRSFSRAALKSGLEEAISGKAEIGAFHSRYFPPGCETDEPRTSGRIQRVWRIRRWNARDFGQNAACRRLSVSTRRSGVFKGIRGELFSRSRFQGILERIGVQSDTDTPDFQVRSSMHAVDHRTRFQAFVDGKNGGHVIAASGVAFLEYDRAISGQCGPKSRPKGKESRHPHGFECRQNSGSSSFIHQLTARTHGRRGQLSRDRTNSSGQGSVPEESHFDGRFWN
jgi:hypothetical protein